MNYGTLLIGDEAYVVMVEFESSYGNGVTSFTSPDAMKVVPLCDHCGNFRLEPVVLHTVDELISSGWIKKKD